jgi:maltooligosyltrehalose trehalohydrolase
MIAGATREAANAQESLGARYLGQNRCQFLVWAPHQRKSGVQLQLPAKGAVSMEEVANGYFQLLMDEVGPGTRYQFLLGEGKLRPDPASRFQPDGVHGPSEVIDPSFAWTDGGWINPPLAQYIFYELHAGLFTAAGTLDAIIPRLPYLKELGITALELMPVAQFPGTRNWGYDGVYPFAVQNSYGGPLALKRLVNQAHREGLAVVLDVVYNHLGPEGNYFRDFAPYFTGKYKTPWGEALNFDGPFSDDVRRFFIENALYWTREFHIDALRLDAIHAIVDSSAHPFVQELTAAAQKQAACGGRAYVIAESDLNDVRVIQPAGSGGFGCDGAWSDDFHHSLHTMLTGEHKGYYRDFGKLEHLSKAYTDGFVYSGQFSEFRQRRHGNSALGAPGEAFVVCAQNHDQIGNRAEGDRLSALVDFESLKLAAGAVMFSPYLPLLFMGEEYGETAPFLYFTSHSDSDLINAVRRGRKEEFAGFDWKREVPDPQDDDTYLRCRLTTEECQSGSQEVLRDFYRELIHLRTRIPALSNLAMDQCEATPIGEQLLVVRRWAGTSEVLLLIHLSTGTSELSIPLPEGQWEKVLYSADPQWLGSGDAPAALIVKTASALRRLALSPRSLLLYQRL